ncbi:unannotated protein [freshwater metagenome]|uniref:Unannotated protein n=1 Tax=freshwater metagenome TaxID=449393 RepID=A0A6J6WXU8_9ZZZZ
MKPIPAPMFLASTVATVVCALMVPPERKAVVSHSAVTAAVVVGNEVMISPQVNAVQGTRVVPRELINRRVSFLARVTTKV